MKRKLPWIAALAAFLILQLFNLFPGVPQDLRRLSFPGAAETVCRSLVPLPNNPDEHGCLCALVAYPNSGFPFRDNLYDTCGQDSSRVWYVQMVNWLIIVAVSAGMYACARLAPRLLQRRVRNRASH